LLPYVTNRQSLLAEIFDLKAGDYHYLGGLPRGTVPVISCGNEENGLCGYFEIKEHVYSHKMTIAFNGATVAAKYHPYEFAAKDDVAVCIPKSPLQLTTLLFLFKAMFRRDDSHQLADWITYCVQTNRGLKHCS
jgi:hypothetical protein